MHQIDALLIRAFHHDVPWRKNDVHKLKIMTFIFSWIRSQFKLCTKWNCNRKSKWLNHQHWQHQIEITIYKIIIKWYAGKLTLTLCANVMRCSWSSNCSLSCSLTLSLSLSVNTINIQLAKRQKWMNSCAIDRFIECHTIKCSRMLVFHFIQDIDIRDNNLKCRQWQLCNDDYHFHNRELSHFGGKHWQKLSISSKSHTEHLQCKAQSSFC